MGKREDEIFARDPEAFVGSNSQKKIKDLYEARVKYKEATLDASDGQSLPLIDLWYDKTMYGRVDDHQDTVWPSETNLVLLTDTCTVLDFVSVAFNDLSAKWKDLQNMGVASSVGIFSELLPFAGWISSHEKYHVYMETVFSDFQTWVRSDGRDTKMLTYTNFMDAFCEFVADRSPHTPFTRSSFLRSTYSDICNTGLNLELEHVGVAHDDDYAKYTAILQDENWELFALLTKQYGFYIDKNAPWRLIANINSAPMREYMAEFGIESTGQMFRLYYYKAFRKDLEAFKPYVMAMWNSFASAFPYQRITTTEEVVPGEYVTRGKLYQRQTIESDTAISETDWLRLYFYVRCKEAGLMWSQTKFDYHLKEVVNIYRATSDLTKTLDYVNYHAKELPSPGGNPTLRKEVDKVGEERYNVRNSTGVVGNYRLRTSWK